MRKKRPCLFAVFAAVLLAAPARGAFQGPLASPRATALAYSSLAAEGDSTALFMNPAALGRLDLVDCYFMHNQLYAGLKGVGDISEGLFSLGVPTRFGTLGFGFGYFRASGLKEERTLSVGYGRALGSRLRFGVAVKQLFHSYDVSSDPLTAADPVFRNGTSRSALSLDLGLIADVSRPLKVALTARNLNQPDVGLATEDRVPRELQLGAAYEIEKAGLRVTADVASRSGGYGNGQRLLPSIGLEKSFERHRVTFRLGATPLELTGGFGVQIGRVGFDYAVILRRALLAGNMGSHSLGLRLRFGGAKSDTPSGPIESFLPPLGVQDPALPAPSVLGDGPAAVPGDGPPAAFPAGPAQQDDPDAGSVPWTGDNQ